MAEANDYICSTLQCGLCHWQVEPPISICPMGHNFCSRCRARSLLCPMCSSPFAESNLIIELIMDLVIQLSNTLISQSPTMPTDGLLSPGYVARNNLVLKIRDLLLTELISTVGRNIAIETHLNNLLYPCPYQANGCDANLTLREISHCEVCVFKPIECPIAQFNTHCPWKGSIYQLRTHLEDQHKFVCVVSSSRLCFIVNFNSEYQHFLSIAPKLQFCLSVGTEGDSIIYRAQLLGISKRLKLTCENTFVFRGNRQFCTKVSPSEEWKILREDQFQRRDGENSFCILFNITGTN